MLRFPKRKSTGSSVLLTPLIDIVFLLLIYFLLTSNFVEQEEIAVTLPKVVNSSLYQDNAVMVLIDQAGQFYLENQAVSDQEFSSLLRTSIAVSSGKGVVIKADKHVVYDRVAQALDIAKTSGALQLHLTVEKKSPAAPPKKDSP